MQRASRPSPRLSRITRRSSTLLCRRPWFSSGKCPCNVNITEKSVNVFFKFQGHGVAGRRIEEKKKRRIFIPSLRSRMRPLKRVNGRSKHNFMMRLELAQRTTRFGRNIIRLIRKRIKFWRCSCDEPYN